MTELQSLAVLADEVVGGNGVGHGDCLVVTAHISESGVREWMILGLIDLNILQVLDWCMLGVLLYTLRQLG